MSNEAGMEGRITLHQINIAGDLLRKKHNGFVNHKDIYFSCILSFC